MKSARVGTRAWAQRQIQSIYKEYGIRSWQFEEMLIWYLAFLAAEKLRTLRDIKADDLQTFDPRPVFVTLPDFEQEVVADLWFELIKTKGHRILDRWKERGVPIYHWLNSVFKYELIDQHEKRREYYRYHAPYAENPEQFDDGATSTNEVITAGDIIMQATNLRETEYERKRPTGAEDWKSDEVKEVEDIVHIEDDAAIPASPWNFPPYFQAFRDFESLNPLNAAIIDAMKTTGGKNALKITRLIKEEGFEVSHDTVGRRVQKLLEVQRAIHASDKNWRHRRAGSTDIFGQRSGMTKAAREAVISETVPEFVQRDFDREGPLTIQEGKAWSQHQKRPPVRYGLTHEVIVAELPENSEPYTIVLFSRKKDKR